MSRKCTTEYKNVYLLDTHGKGRPVINGYRYKLRIKGKMFLSISTKFKTAKDAALALDKKLIENGLEPINILKRL